MLKEEKPMRFKKIIVLLICLIVILGTGCYMIDRNTDNAACEEIALSFNEDDIKEINVKEQDGEFTWVKKDNMWTIADAAKDMNTTAISNYISEILKIHGRKIDTKIESPADYGLDNPLVEIEYVLKNGTKTTVKLGNPTPAQTEYYMSDDVNNLYVIYSSAGVEMKRRAMEFYDTLICSIPYESIVKIDVTGDNGFTLDNNGSDTWTYIRGDVAHTVDTEVVKINVTKSFNNMYALNMYRKTEEKLSAVSTYEIPVTVTFSLVDGGGKCFEIYGLDEKHCWFTVNDGEYVYQATSNYFDFIIGI